MQLRLISRLVVVCCLGLSVVAVCGYSPVSAFEGKTTVAVNIVESISVTGWPEEFMTLSHDAVPGDVIRSPKLIFSVKSNSPWGIEIHSDHADGRLQEFDPLLDQYVPGGVSVKQPLQWASELNGPWHDLSGSPRSLISGHPCTGDEGADVSMYLRFSPSYSDPPVGDGKEYRITMHYTVGLSY